MCFRLIAAVAAFASPSLAHAQSAIVLWPTDPRIVATEQATALWLENHGKEPVTLQIRAQDWTQAGGANQEGPTQAVISSPPIATIAPGERQLVRVIRRGSAPVGEKAYRLLVDELPKPAPATEGGVAARLSVQMRYSLPLFTYGEAADGLTPQLRSAVRLVDGKRWIEISNSGSRHARLTDLRVGSGAAVRTVQAGLVGYVLPGATMRWPLPDDFVAPAPITIGVNGADLSLSISA
ncbi:fimbrial biogenesis chaperone [Sphingomonas baiyangensis]|uniref:Molecular chaperone n=1 Tax=Sphingomonas baiyangensis TaxID=2572576 RepID=A0A4U1LAD7_9SPHN|nr:molecular chaperone [Sphingomonas baiyangensis]TKD53326.1 molecular chaperone [Sphingomonas baiyangensis]